MAAVTSPVKFASVYCFDKDLKQLCCASVTKVDLFSEVAFKSSEDGDDDSVAVSCVHVNSDVDVDFQSKPMVDGTEEQIFAFFSDGDLHREPKALGLIDDKPFRFTTF